MRLTVVRSPVARGRSRRPDLPPSEAGSRDQGCRRRPKTKYEIGSDSGVADECDGRAHRPFPARIWLASVSVRLMLISGMAQVVGLVF